MRGRHLSSSHPPHWMSTEPPPRHDRLIAAQSLRSYRHGRHGTAIVPAHSVPPAEKWVSPLERPPPTTPGQRHERSRARLAAQRGLHLSPPGAFLPDRHCRTGLGSAGAGTTDMPQLPGTAGLPGMGDRRRRRRRHLGWTQRAGTPKPPAPAARWQTHRIGPAGAGPRGCPDRPSSITSTHRERSERSATSPAPRRGARGLQALIVTAGSVVLRASSSGLARAWVLGTGSSGQRW